MPGCDSVKASQLDGHILLRHQHEHFRGLTSVTGAVQMQTTLKWPPVMLADKGYFGEWVKRRMNYQNKTKKTKTTPPKETAQPQSCVLQYSSVSPVERNALSKQDRNRTYGFTRTSIHQLSCSNKYLISIKTHAFDPPATIPTTVTNQKRVIKEHQVVFKITL